MELTTTDHREYRMQRHSSRETEKIEFALSREKALRKSAGKVAVPAEGAIDLLFELYHKIGADRELPAVIDRNHTRGIEARKAYLADFWRTIYLTNNLCPGDIPFDIIFTEFIAAIMHGRAERRGNNQAALCQAFNAWIIQPEVKHKLYELRDQRYPQRKPLQIAERAKEKELKDYSNEELNEQFKKTERTIRKFPVLKFPLEWKAKLEAEMSERGFVHVPLYDGLRKAGLEFILLNGSYVRITKTKEEEK